MTSKIKVGLTLFTKDIHGQKGIWAHHSSESKQMEQIFFLWTKSVARINAYGCASTKPQEMGYLSDSR